MYTIANSAISSEPLFTDTAVGTVGVDALGVNITRIGISETLIDICRDKMQLQLIVCDDSFFSCPGH